MAPNKNYIAAEGASEELPKSTNVAIQDQLPSEKIPVLDDNGKVYHIPNNEASIADAKQLGYRLASEESDQIRGLLQDKFKDQFSASGTGRGVITGLQNIIPSAANAIENTINGTFPLVGAAEYGIKKAFESVTGNAVPSNDEAMQMALGLGGPEWQDIPSQYRRNNFCR